MDKSTNVLSEPNKMQFQIIEGEYVFNEGISFLRNLPPLKPLIWDDCLALSAKDHVDDIGPKGLLSYQSSDGTEPEDRISKYGQFIDSLGENIDFGPNDSLGVIVSLTLDDGEENRPHRENIFKSDYCKVGIACGSHQSEYQMCVMDFAFDFIPFETNKNKKEKSEVFMNLKNLKNKNAEYDDINNNKNTNANNDKGIKANIQSLPSKEVIKPEDKYSQLQPQFQQQNKDKTNPNIAQQQLDKSPYVKLSLDNEDLKKTIMNNNEHFNQEENNDFDYLTSEVNRVNNYKQIIKKNVEIITKITYIYENGSSRVIQERKTHSFYV